MNILVPHQWLLEHLKTKAKPQEIQEYLSLSGPSVERILEIEGDQVYDIEITTNRPDALSMRGIAREATVILSRNGLASELKPLKPVKLDKLETDELLLPEINNDPSLCQRIVCIVLDKVKNKPTPSWMAKRLTQAGFQTHHSIIDITNYITHDLGHPCHAFDYDKIMELGGVINVEEAKPGRPFTTLDGEERETVGGEIVFTNQVGTIIDLPAIIGTANSSVDENTKRVLLWLEDLDAKKVRQASMAHAIRTVAAQLNEKELDPYLGEDTLQQAVKLYQDITDAKIASQVYDQFIEPEPLKSISLDNNLVTAYLGLELELDQIKQILTDLGCKVKISAPTKRNQKSGKFVVTPPSYRQDLQIPADLIEEVARIYGYHNLPSKLMTGQLPTNPPQDLDFQVEHKIKMFLANIGWQEMYTLSLVSEELVQKTSLPLEEHLALSNPLLTENSHLRRSLLPSLVEALEANPQEENLSVFELAAVYHPRPGDLPEEIVKVGLVSNKSYREVRGDLDALLRQFYLEGVRIEEAEEVREAEEGGQQKGVIKVEGEVELGHLSVLENQIIGIELDLNTLVIHAKKHPAYQPSWHTTPIIEDLTFTLMVNTRVGDVLEAIKSADKLVTKVELVDHYQQNFSFRVYYQHKHKNLSTDELKPVRQKVVETVEQQTEAKLVGRV